MSKAVVGSLRRRGAAPPEGLQPVSLGPLSLALGELEVRYVRLAGTELIRRLFVAVRDVEWGTAPMVAEKVAVDVREDLLESSMTALCQEPEHGIELRWTGTLRCQADGVIEFAFQGTPLRHFRFGRIGLCVLHPPDFAGGQYQARTADGWIEGALEETIAPQRPGEHGFGEPLFPAFEELVLQRADGVGLHLWLSGDLFEFEDQRNWGDASYKTYSTPLHLGPQLAEPGQVIEQRVVIESIAPSAKGRSSPSPATPTVELGAGTTHLVPDTGVVLSGTHEDEASVHAFLQALEPAHLRIDVSLDEDGWSAHLRRAARIAKDLEVPVELAITRTAAVETVEELGAHLSELHLRIVRLLVFRRGSTVTEPTDVVDVRRCLAAAGTSAAFYGGTDVLFADLNGDRPDIDALEGVAFPLVPTVHADDDLSLIETMSVFADIIRTARTFTGELPLAVTPVSLRERPRADERQSTLLGAVWALGAMSGLAGVGAESVTLFETTGPRGVIVSDESSARAYPAYHVLADVCGWRGWHFVPVQVSDPLAVACLAVREPKGVLAALIANALPRPNRVHLRGFPDRQLRIRRMNEERLGAATSDPIAFRGVAEDLAGNVVELSPYELVRLDVAA